MRVRTIAPVSVRVTLGLACMLASASPLLAQVDEGGDPPATPTRAETAAVRHRAAVAAYAKGDYRDAIELFREANRLRPSAALSFNVARSYEQLGDASSALAWYRDYARRSDRVSDTRQVERRIARLEKRLAKRGVQQVTIDSSPRGASVWIDRNRVGVSPWTGDLALGVHSVELTLQGFEGLSQQFDLPGDHALDLQLALAAKRVPEKPRPPPVIQQRRAVLEVQRAPPLARTSPAKPEEGSTFTTVGWIVLGSGAATLGTALVFELSRRNAEADAQQQASQIQFAQDVERMRSRQTVARVLGGAGAGLAVAGGILLVVGAGDGERAPDARVGLACAPLPCRAALVGRF